MMISLCVLWYVSDAPFIIIEHIYVICAKLCAYIYGICAQAQLDKSFLTHLSDECDVYF